MPDMRGTSTVSMLPVSHYSKTSLEIKGVHIREMIMATCMDCGKKISKFFGRSNMIEGKLICGNCDDKRREKEKMETTETKRAGGK
jgi:hypothetical protein